MSWQTPKTDWYGYTNSSGEYTGDRFNVEDFNRIKNNLDVLHGLAVRLFSTFTINELGDDRSPGDYFYADEINKLEENLATINEHTYKLDIGSAPTYEPNGTTMDYVELNRLESTSLTLYELLMNQQEGLRMFEWNFGFKGGEF